MQHVNGIPVYRDDPTLHYDGLQYEPTWFSAQGGVYRCTSRKNPSKFVAIKKYLVEETELYPDLFVMPKELVENEIYTMTKCNHVNILKLLGVYLHQEFVYLIMPYCTGGSLQQYVFEHHLTIGQLVHITKSIASGLAEVHRHGYIHRDIKCDNIFLMQETNEIVIGDFGVVSISPAADSNIEEAGVVLFWSPELVQRKIVNRKIDVWALGIVIMEILNGGKAPYEDDNLSEDEIKQRILDIGKPEYPRDLPSSLVDILDKCLNPDPRARINAADILQVSAPTPKRTTHVSGSLLRDPQLIPFIASILVRIRSGAIVPGNRIDDNHDDVSETMSVEDTAVGDAVDDVLTATRDDNIADVESVLQKLSEFEDTELVDERSDGDQRRPSRSPSLSPTYSTESSASTVEDRQPSPSLSQPHLSTTDDRSHCHTAPPDAAGATAIATATIKDGATRKTVTISDIRRCRIPLRAFTLTEEMARTSTVQEKVLGVLRKRQSISEAHWGQGSRLPMFKSALLTMERFLEEEEAAAAAADCIKPTASLTEKRVVRRAKSVRLLSPKDNNTSSADKPTRRPLFRANSVPASQSSDLLLHKKSGENTRTAAKTTGITASIPSKRLPQSKTLISSKQQQQQQSGGNKAGAKAKQSIYRRKKFLPGESRTARLMMGVSTNGRQHQRVVSPSSATTPGNRQQQKEVEAGSGSTRRTAAAEVSTTMKVHRFGYSGSTSDAKKRPASFNGMSSKHSSSKKVSHPESNCLPKYSLKAPSKKGSSPGSETADTVSPGNNNKTNRNGGTPTFKGAKVVRVH